ncbi:MAG: helix-turn-helix domain-containing protein [Actinomycetota bacterium]
MTLGRQIAAQRRSMGLTQAEFARRLRNSQPAISRIESGEISPTFRFLERCVEVTQQPLEVVICPAQEPPSREELNARVRRVLGDYVFDPWERNPSEAEARSLLRDGLTRDRFDRREAAPARVI